MQEREAKDQHARGTQKARQLDEERVTYKDAISRGLIKPSESPWFRAGAEQQFGRAAAGQYARALQAALQSDEAMQVSTDPADFSPFEASFRKDWLEANVGEKNRNTHFESGFKIVDGYATDAASQFTAWAGARMEKLAGERVGIVIGQVLDQHFKEGVETTAGLINAEMQAYLTDNPKAGRATNLRAVQAIESWARINYKTVGKEDIESLLRQVDGGPGSKLFGTNEAKEMLNRVEREIISMRGASANLEHAEERRQDEEQERTFWTEMNTVFVEAMQNGKLASVDLTPYVSRLTAIDPSSDAALEVFRLRDGFINAKAPGNDEAYRNALMWAEGVSPGRPGQFLSTKQLARYAASEGLNGPQFGSVLNAIQERQQRAQSGSGGGSSLLRDPFYAAGEQYIRGKMLDPYGANGPLARSAAEEAVRDFGVEFLRRRVEIAGITDPAKQSELINALAEQAFRLHAPREILRMSNKEQVTTQRNAEAQSVFQRAAAKIKPADIPQINTAARDFRRGVKTPAMAQLLKRLGVPLDDAQIRLFFLEWERNDPTGAGTGEWMSGPMPPVSQRGSSGGSLMSAYFGGN